MNKNPYGYPYTGIPESECADDGVSGNGSSSGEDDADGAGGL